jgi:hypothetical protein
MSRTDQRDLAKKVRAKKLAQLTEIYNACECEYPLVSYRNLHGHGRTASGVPCPAITVWERQRHEHAEAKALAEET